MAELHIIGQIVGGSGFPSSRLFCKWGIQAGRGWEVLGGLTEGHTQTDNPENVNIAYWCHPLDIHFATKGLQGWPKFHFEVWYQDCYSRHQLWSYGFCHVPTSPGFHKFDCVTWQPIGTMHDEIVKYFIGGSSVLTNSELIYSGLDRYRFQTVAMGKIHLELNILLRNFNRFGVVA